MLMALLARQELQAQVLGNQKPTWRDDLLPLYGARVTALLCT
jgi:hypothetical protein